MEQTDLKTAAATNMTGFVAAVADQVKNPVASLLLATDFFEQEFAKLKNGEPLNYAIIEKMIMQVRTRLHSLNSYVDELSSYAKPVKINPSRVDVLEILREVISGLSKNTFWQGKIELISENPTSKIFCDTKIFQQICKSIFLNALESKTPQNKLRIQVEIKQEESSTQGIRLKIRDNGPGIDHSYKEKISEPFFSTKEASTGLGLALAKKYVEAHSGEFKISSRSTLGGAEIEFFFPDEIKSI